MRANQGLPDPKYTIADILHRLTPQARILLMFRDPVERCVRNRDLIHSTTNRIWKLTDLNSISSPIVSIPLTYRYLSIYTFNLSLKV